jgi:type IV pilus assembly protein PilM
MQAPSLNFSLGRRKGPEVVGLDIQPGHVAAVQARVNGALVAERAAALPLPADTMREGELLDTGALKDALRELFANNRLSKRVRIGVANQRTVLRTLELPPVTDRKELAAAVRFQAQDQVPMPLDNAVLDFQALGVFDSPAGPRQRVVLVAAQRDMIERLLATVRDAGLRPEGIDLSAFALIRSLYHADPEHEGRVLYLNIDGLTNMAIADGSTCRFTRVLARGLEAMAAELAERRGIPLEDARELLVSTDPASVLGEQEPFEDLLATPPATDPEERAEVDPAEVDPAEVDPAEVESAHGDQTEAQAPTESVAPEHEPGEGDPNQEPAPAPSTDEAKTASESFAMVAHATQSAQDAPVAPGTFDDHDVRLVRENGMREIAGEVRNSLDFHRSQEGGGEVTRVVLSGLALDLPGFADTLHDELGIEVQCASVRLADGRGDAHVSPHRLAIATGLSVAEVTR